VDKILFEKTSTSYIDQLLKDKISNKTKDCFKKWEALKSIIEICDLMTLFKGLRVKPTPSEANPRGYTDGYDVLHQGRNYNIGPDKYDISKYNWDTRRLYPLLDAAFDRSALHLSQLGFRNHDVIQIFDDMEKHFEGRDAKDILYHTMNLHRFLPLPKEYDIKEDIVRLNDLFQQVDLVTGAPLSDIYKLSYFMCHFQHDPRPMVASRIQTLDFTKCNYNDMYRAIHELSVVSPLPIQHVKSLTQNPKKKRPKSNDICRNFQTGTCKFPDCIYKHVLLDATATKTPPVIPPKDPKSKALPSKTRYPTHITSEHRRQIGAPAGVVTAANPTGISRKQLFALRVFDRAHTDSGYESDPWQSGAIGHASGSSRGNDHPPLLMFRTSSSSSSSATAAATSSPIGDSSDGSDEAPDEVILSPARWNGNVRCTSVEFAHAYTTQQLLIEYNDHLIETEDDPRNWVLFIRRYADIKERSDIPLCAIFGWTTRGVSRSLSQARPDVATGSPTLMHALYLLGASYFDATAPSTWGTGVLPTS
jgi:hypothetical protein